MPVEILNISMGIIVFTKRYFTTAFKYKLFKKTLELKFILLIFYKLRCNNIFAGLILNRVF